MEVPVGGTLLKSPIAALTEVSAKGTEFYCDICDKKAHGYCKNCEEYLCDICCTSHRRVGLTKNHIILGKEKMPKVQKQRKWDKECVEKCPHHPTEVIIYYCKKHDLVGCHECMSSNHSDCFEDYIPDIASGTKGSFEYRKMLQELDTVKSEAVRKEKNGNKDLETVGLCYTKVIDDMQRFKQDVNNQLDKMEDVLSAEAREAMQNAIATINDYQKECNIIKSSVEEMEKDIKQDDISASQIFILLKLYKIRLDECRKMLNEQETLRNVRTFIFEPSLDVKDILEKKFGELIFAKSTEDKTVETLREKVVSASCGKLNVKSSKNEINCDIVSIDMLSPQELVFADFRNMAIKIYCLRKCKVTNKKELPVQPNDITVLNGDTIAVLLTHELVIMRKSDNLQREKKVKLAGTSYGLACLKDNLLLLSSVPFPKIDLLNQEGEVLRTILSDQQGKILKSPRHISVSKDEMYIYVTDYDSENKITRFSMAGDALDAYKSQNENDNVIQPREITVADDGSLFVCDFIGNNIHMCSGDLSDMMTILTEADGIKRPQAIYFCNKERKLFVANDDCDDILIYRLNW